MQKLVYAAGFTFVLPACLAAWAWATPFGHGLPLPPHGLGPPLAVAGSVLWVWAVAVFRRTTGKLPLNADPPDRAVTSGPYVLFDDPIYVGFVTGVLGVAISAGSAPGVWIVAPALAAAAVALVLGYEGQHRPVRRTSALLRWPAALTGPLAAVILAAVLLADQPLTHPASLSILGALAIFAVAAPRLHRLAVRLATAIANSWAAVRLGPVRIISYAAYAALAAGAGALVFMLTAPGPSVPMAALISASVVLGGGVWGKLLESTGRLARPFGYFGAVLGGAAGVGAASQIWDVPLLTLGASVALAATVTQGVGRLRCLVQGCCHGRPIPNGPGVCYRRPESRAVALAGLGGQALYPTPVFSVYANLFSGVVLLTLHFAQQGASALLAAYLLIAGLSRFAEEGFRGETSVRRWRGLTIYQWLAIGQVIAAAVLGLVAAPPLPGFQPLAAEHLLTALAIALGAGFAMGVDFPDLDAPLARLTPRLED